MAKPDYSPRVAIIHPAPGHAPELWIGYMDDLGSFAPFHDTGPIPLPSQWASAYVAGKVLAKDAARVDAPEQQGNSRAVQRAMARFYRKRMELLLSDYRHALQSRNAEKAQTAYDALLALAEGICWRARRFRSVFQPSTETVTEHRIMSDRIANFVNKFLGWKLPQTFSPDCYIKFDRELMAKQTAPSWPIGTNLLTATEARAMFEYVLTDDPVLAALAELVAVKDIKDRGEALHFAGPSGPLGEGWEAEWKRLQKEYIERQPKAWAAARAALGVGASHGDTFSRQPPTPGA